VEAVSKAIWYIESHFADEISLEEVAEVVGISRFHMSRIFTQATGSSFADYLRGRRLTEAAKAIAGGAPSFLDVAISAGYGSHEAFTRAFKDKFRVTPEQARAAASIRDLPNLTEPLKMPQIKSLKMGAPQFCERPMLLIAGFQHYFKFQDRGGIPSLWQRFTEHIGHIPTEVRGSTYGVCLTPSSGDDEGFDYLAGVEVRSFDLLAEGLVGLRIPSQTWARFSHQGHVSEIASTCAGAVEWLRAEGRAAAGGRAQMIEYYGPGFDPRTGLGGCEVWLPVAQS
jgi:AraC family transcriptional regulator